MDTLITIVVLLILAIGEFFIYRHIKNASSGVKWYMVPVVILAEVAGIIAGVFLLAVLWKPVTKIIVDSAGTSAGLTSAFIFSGLAVAAIWGLWVFVRKLFAYVLPGEPAKWFSRITMVVAIVSSVYFLLDATGLATLHGGVWQWTARISIIVLASILGVVAIRWWYPEGQKLVGVGATYVINMVVSGIGLTSLGYNAFATLNGTIYTLLFFVALNFGLFWLTFGLGNPDKPLKSRLSFWVMSLWTIIWVLVCAYMVINIGIGRITWPDAEANRLLTEARKTVEVMERQAASEGMTKIGEEVRSLSASGNADDLTSAKAKLAAMEVKAAKQNAVVRKASSLPSAMQEDLDRLRNARPFDIFRNPSGIEPAEEVGFKLTKISSVCWEVDFFTDKPVQVLRRWSGQSISFAISSLGVPASFSTSGAQLVGLPMGIPITPNGAILTLQAKKGVKVTMNF